MSLKEWKQHNHITRDIKPLGQCPSCDEYHNRHIPKAHAIDKISNDIIVGATSVTMPKKAFDVIYRDFQNLQKKIDILKRACEQYDDMEMHPTKRTLQLSPAAQALKDIEEIK